MRPVCLEAVPLKGRLASGGLFFTLDRGDRIPICEGGVEGAEHLVPEAGADSVAPRVVAEVMTQVALALPLSLCNLEGGG